MHVCKESTCKLCNYLTANVHIYIYAFIYMHMYKTILEIYEKIRRGEKILKGRMGVKEEEKKRGMEMPMDLKEEKG